MGKKIDLTGHKYNRLTVISEAGMIDGRLRWNCRCECGTQLIVSGNALRRNNTKSCGCLKIETTADKRRTHGKSRTKEYTTWSAMISRCEYLKRPDYHHYGGRGIKVCQRWRDSFEAFLADMGPRPFPGASLDRKDHNGDYTPENCQWASQKQQTRNCRDNHWITYNGKTQCLTDWAEQYGIKPRVLWARVMRCGWPLQQALETPLQKVSGKRAKGSRTYTV